MRRSYVAHHKGKILEIGDMILEGAGAIAVGGLVIIYGDTVVAAILGAIISSIAAIVFGVSIYIIIK